jgi:hypothetical protein
MSWRRIDVVDNDLKNVENVTKRDFLQRLRRVDGCRKTFLKKKNTMSWLSLTPQDPFALAIVYGVFVAKNAKQQMRHFPFSFTRFLPVQAATGSKPPRS